MAFIISQQPHPTFTREGNDLILLVKLDLVTALTGGTVQVNTLDARRLSVVLDRVVAPGSERVLPGEGMSITKGPQAGRRGNLRLRFEVAFPTSLTQEQKDQIRPILLQ